MAKLRAGVHEVARGRVGCKLGITPLNQMGLGVGGTHDIGGGGAVVAAVGGGARLAVGVGRTSRLPLVDDQVNGHLALEAADIAVAEVVTQLVYLHRGPGLEAAAEALEDEEVCNLGAGGELNVEGCHILVGPLLNIGLFATMNVNH